MDYITNIIRLIMNIQHSTQHRHPFLFNSQAATQKMSSFCGVCWSITAFTTVHYWPLSWAKWIESTSEQTAPLQIHVNITLPSMQMPTIHACRLKILYVILIIPKCTI